MDFVNAIFNFYCVPEIKLSYLIVHIFEHKRKLHMKLHYINLKKVSFECPANFIFLVQFFVIGLFIQK